MGVNGLLVRVLTISAFTLITAGVSLCSIPAGLICAGFCLLAVTALMFVEVGRDETH